MIFTDRLKAMGEEIKRLRIEKERLHAQQEIMSSPHWEAFTASLKREYAQLGRMALAPTSDEQQNGAQLQYATGYRAGQAHILSAIVKRTEGVQKEVDRVDADIAKLKQEAERLAQAGQR